MLKNYLKIALRTLQKYKGYTIINVFGLAIGLASAILILLFVQDELSYDKHHKKADQIHRITLTGRIMSDDLNVALSSYPIGPTLKEEFPTVENAVRIQPQEKSVIRIEDQRYIEDHLLFADSTIFDVFTMPMLKGSQEKALAEPNKVVLTESTAQRYFGSTDVLGKTIEWTDRNRKLEVSGIIKDCPETSHFKYDLLVSFVTTNRAENQLWVSNNVYTYLLLQKGTTPESVEEQFPGIVEKYVGPQLEQVMGLTIEEFYNSGNKWGYHLQPLTKIYLHSDLNNEIGETGNFNNVYFFSIIAIFLILIAAINFMNLATAKSANRAKEVGIRKVAGSRRKQLIFQFLTEAMLISFIALIVAVLFVELALPYFNTFADKSLSINYFDQPQILIVLILIGLVVGLLAGSYPAFYLSAFSPVAVLKGKISRGSKNSRLRGVLVVFQFIITIVLIISTILVSRQMNYMNDKDLGFQKEHMLIVNRVSALGGNQEAFRQEILKNPKIKQASFSQGVPGTIRSNTAFYAEGHTAQESMVMDVTAIDCYFDDAYNIEMASGRFFSEDYSIDSLGVLVNQAAARKLGFEKTVGKKLILIQGDEREIDFKILGVVKDFNYKSLHNSIKPLVMIYANNRFTHLSIQVSPDQINNTLSFVENKWSQFVQETPFNYSFLENDWAAKYRQEKRANIIFKIFSLLAIAISCLGLFGLASFMAEQRTKEIGVRKVFGATVPQILKILSKEVIILIIISTLIAWPLGYYFMNQWLQDFAYRVDISFVTFIVASFVTFAIALITISYRAYNAAVVNPAESLRDE